VQSSTPLGPDQVNVLSLLFDAAVTGGVHYGQAVLTTLVKGVRDDHPSISALPETRWRSICPTLEAEVGTTCEEQFSFQDVRETEKERKANDGGGGAENMDEGRVRAMEMVTPDSSDAGSNPAT
jgi:hypothetical protein